MGVKSGKCVVAVLILESWGTLHPAACERDAAERLLRAALKCAEALLAEQGRQQGIVQARASKTDERSRAAFRTVGFSRARDLISTTRPTLDDVPEPVFPEEIDVHPYRPGADDAAWVGALHSFR